MRGMDGEWGGGGNDEALEDEWRWNSNLQKMCFIDRGTGKPNNNNGGHENCLSFFPPLKLQWNDLDQGLQPSYIDPL